MGKPQNLVGMYFVNAMGDGYRVGRIEREFGSTALLSFEPNNRADPEHPMELVQIDDLTEICACGAHPLFFLFTDRAKREAWLEWKSAESKPKGKKSAKIIHMRVPRTPPPPDGGVA